jgi:hypothetical protein
VYNVAIGVGQELAGIGALVRSQAGDDRDPIIDPAEDVQELGRDRLVHQADQRGTGLDVPAQRRAHDQASGKVLLACHEERRERVALAREVGWHRGEHAWIERRIDDVAFVIREQQLAREAARESPDGGLLGEPREEPGGGGVRDPRLVGDRARFLPRPCSTSRRLRSR